MAPRIDTMDLPIGMSRTQLLRIATSAFGAIAIAEDGSLLYWTQDSKLKSYSEGGPVPGFMGSVIVDIAAGHDHFLALTVDGFLYAWGANQYHQCSPEPLSRIHTPVKVTSKQIIACAAGGHSSLCIDSNGVVYTWGRASTSLTVPIDSPLVQSASESSSAPGDSSSSSAASSDATSTTSPAPSVRPSTRITHRTIAVDLLSHGGEMSKTRTDPRFVSELTSIWLPEDLTFIQASMSPTMTVLVARDGSAWAWGDANAICGSSIDSISLTPVRIPFPKGTRIVRALAGDIHALALDSTGRLWTWGNRFVGGQLAKDASPNPEPTLVSLPDQSAIVDFGISQNESVIINAASQVFTWQPFEPVTKVEPIRDSSNLAVGVSHGPSCPVSYFVLGGSGAPNKAAFGYGQRASQIYSLEDMDEPENYETEPADEESSATDSAVE